MLIIAVLSFFCKKKTKEPVALNKKEYYISVNHKECARDKLDDHTATPFGKVLRLDVDGYIQKKLHPVVRWDFFYGNYYTKV